MPLKYKRQFIQYATLECGLAKLTVRAYNTDLGIFENFLSEKYGDDELLPSRQDVSEFMEHSRNEGCADTTVARRLVSIKAYSRYLAIAGHTPEDVTEVMLSPKTWKRVPECLSIQQMRSILELWNDPQDVISLRNRAILEILYASGIRVAELCTLKANAVNFQDGILKVMGKGSKERMVPCSEAAIGALSAYLKVREQLKPRARENSLFLGRQGTQINRRSVYEIVRTSGIQAGIGDGVHPHLLRHSFATHLLANGADLRAIQEMLGHASISTTQIYTHADTSRLKDAFNKFFPRA